MLLELNMGLKPCATAGCKNLEHPVFAGYCGDCWRMFSTPAKQTLRAAHDALVYGEIDEKKLASVRQRVLEVRQAIRVACSR